ncbi:single-strand selective monofunctional uracil DNA glycosylase-like isoform X1 [Daktulosphaira vitifoliae]|uniref:single-strand selective monofunctional uracil DNA glycosylase-like isoform X1 n=1 Tax=Daktulosphaira vitifoliae TaxID=58002 RepID=UPI0021AA0BA0|nr:single-strand selective monofunctional uracil DNA glycosylase-like isoform X1 [Daktulosphaira vitifoliae]
MLSEYFSKPNNKSNVDEIVYNYLQLENDLQSNLEELNFGPDISYIYKPLTYASDLHKKFVTKFLFSHRNVLFLGMNPGPWGMCQTGIPFGEINAVKNYLQIDGEVNIPQNIHPSRPILGLNCTNKEISGQRFWELINEESDGDPFRFFKHCFIHNYFPFALMNKNAKNITPAELKSDKRKHLENICDESLRSIIELLNVSIIVAIGKYVEKRSLEVVKQFNLCNVKVINIRHPSPRALGTAENWKIETINQLKSNNIIQLFK